MTTEIILLALLVLSNAWWAYQAHKLINKILSRSYHEYMQAEKVGVQRKARPPAPAPAIPPTPGDSSAISVLDQMRATLMPFSGGR